MRSIRWRLASCLLAVAVAVIPVLATGVTKAAADAEPGSGLASYGLSANAPTVTFTEDNATAAAHPEAEGDLPEAVSTLGSTGGAYALSTVLWPGALAGNLGTLLIAANPSVPQQASILDDPVRAEAKNNQGTVTNNSYPGMSLKASSFPALASASALLQGASVPGALSVGTTSAVSTTQVVGASTVSATATGSLHNIKLAGGALGIASLQSSASALSDGRTATASGSTTVSGATVAGVPVTIDERGVHVAGSGQPIPSQVQDTVNSALASLGMTVTLIGPNKTITAGTARYVASTLVIIWTPPQSPNPHEKIVIAFGGASVTAAAAPGFAFPVPGLLPPPSQPTLPAEVGLPAHVGQQVEPGTGIGVTPPTGRVPAPVTAPFPAATTAFAALPGALAIGWLVAWVALAAAFGLGLFRRLPTAFAAAATTRCPWENS